MHIFFNWNPNLSSKDNYSKLMGTRYYVYYNFNGWNVWIQSWGSTYRFFRKLRRLKSFNQFRQPQKRVLNRRRLSFASLTTNWILCRYRYSHTHIYVYVIANRYPLSSYQSHGNHKSWRRPKPLTTRPLSESSKWRSAALNQRSIIRNSFIYL